MFQIAQKKHLIIAVLTLVFLSVAVIPASASIQTTIDIQPMVKVSPLGIGIDAVQKNQGIQVNVQVAVDSTSDPITQPYWKVVITKPDGTSTTKIILGSQTYQPGQTYTEALQTGVVADQSGTYTVTVSLYQGDPSTTGAVLVNTDTGTFQVDPQYTGTVTITSFVGYLITGLFYSVMAVAGRLAGLGRLGF